MEDKFTLRDETSYKIVTSRRRWKEDISLASLNELKDVLTASLGVREKRRWRTPDSIQITKPLSLETVINNLQTKAEKDNIQPLPIKYLFEVQLKSDKVRGIPVFIQKSIIPDVLRAICDFNNDDKIDISQKVFKTTILDYSKKPRELIITNKGLNYTL